MPVQCFEMEGEEEIYNNAPCNSYYDSDDILVIDSSADLILCDIPNSSDEEDNIPFENVIPGGRGGSLNLLQTELQPQSQSKSTKGTKLIFDPTTMDYYCDSDCDMDTSWMGPNERRLMATLSHSSDGRISDLDWSDGRVWLVEGDRSMLVDQNIIENDDDGYDLIIEDVVSDDGEIISRRITQMAEEVMENKENVAVGMSSTTLSDVGENDPGHGGELSRSHTPPTPLHSR